MSNASLAPAPAAPVAPDLAPMEGVLPMGKPIERDDFAPRANATRNITIIEGRVSSGEYGTTRKLDMSAQVPA